MNKELTYEEKYQVLIKEAKKDIKEILLKKNKPVALKMVKQPSSIYSPSVRIKKEIELKNGRLIETITNTRNKISFKNKVYDYECLSIADELKAKFNK